MTRVILTIKNKRKTTYILQRPRLSFCSLDLCELSSSSAGLFAYVLTPPQLQ